MKKKCLVIVGKSRGEKIKNNDKLSKIDLKTKESKMKIKNVKIKDLGNGYGKIEFK